VCEKQKSEIHKDLLIKLLSYPGFWYFFSNELSLGGVYPVFFGYFQGLLVLIPIPELVQKVHETTSKKEKMVYVR